jgi:hypothetical protein
VSPEVTEYGGLGITVHETAVDLQSPRIAGGRLSQLTHLPADEPQAVPGIAHGHEVVEFFAQLQRAGAAGDGFLVVPPQGVVPAHGVESLRFHGPVPS